MIKLIVIRGLPCSGKTTLAKKLKDEIESKPGWNETRITSGHWTWKEIEEPLKLGFNVIVDDLNLSKKDLSHFENIAHNFKAEFEIKDLTDVPIDVCIERDSKKKEPWGDTFIKDLAKKYKIGFFAARKVKEKDPTLLDCVIFDIDGTVSFCNERNPYDTDNVDKDTPNEPALYCLDGFFSREVKVFFLTGRDEVCRGKTHSWLVSHNLTRSFDYPDDVLDTELLMRPKNDKRRDSIVKKELYEQHIKGKYNVLAVFEDRERVIKETWLPEGIFVFDCGQGEKF